MSLFTYCLRQLFVVLFLGSSYAAFATIEVVSTTLASADGTCDGSITVRAQGTAGPFEIMAIGTTPSQPINGVNGPNPVTISGLCAGTYEVAVTNAYGCVNVITTSVAQCAAITLVNSTQAVQHPTQCGATNGSINLTAANFSGSVPPYTYRWSTGATTASIINLSSGSYTLTVTSAQGCAATHTFTLQAPNEVQVRENITPTCGNTTNGSISIFIYTGQIPGSGGTNRGPYTFRWSNGTVQSGVPATNPTSRIEGLAAGTYTVTVEDQSGTCLNITKTFTVPGSSVTPLTISGVVENTCPEEAKGAIQLQLSGGSAPYRVYWDGSSSTSGERLSNLSPGSHCARVVDRCGIIANQCFEVPFQQNLVFDVTTIQLQHAKPGIPGAIALSPTKSGSYSYQWSTGSTGNAINNLPSATYYVTITNNTTGCSIKRDYFVKNCADMQSDFEVAVFGGSALDPTKDIELNLLLKPGPSYSFGTVLPAGFTIKWSAPDGTVLGNGFALTLNKNTTYDKVIINVSDGCSTKRIEKTILKCNTQGDQSLQNSFIVSTKKPCTGLTDGAVSLSIPILSGTTATIILNATTQIPVTYQNGNAIANIVNLSGTQQNSLQITSGSCMYNFTFKLGEEQTEKIFKNVDVNNNICYYHQTCNEVSLGDDFIYQSRGVLDFWNSRGSIVRECSTPVLCNGEKKGEKEFGKAWAGLLEYEILLQKAKNIYGFDYINYAVIPGYELGIGASGEFRSKDRECLRIRYCKGSLKFLSVGVVSELRPKGNATVNSHGCYEVRCAFPSKDYLACGFSTGIYYPDGPNGPPNPPPPLPPPAIVSEEIFNRILVDSNQTEELVNFAIAQDGPLINPRGIINTDFGQAYDYFNRLNNQVSKDTIYNIEHMIEEWNYEYNVYIEQVLKSKASKLIYADSLKVWEKTISADTLFKIQHLSTENKQTIIAGIFIGELKYDSTVIASADSSACFLLRVLSDGTLNDLTLIENIDLNGNIAFSENRNGSVVIAGKHNGNLKANQIDLLSANESGFFILRVDSTNQVQLIKNLRNGENMKVLDVTYSESDSNKNIAMAFSGTDTLNANGEFIFKDSSSQINLISIAPNDTVTWTTSVLADSINLDKFDMAYGRGDSLFVGLTFRDRINFLNDTLQSAGEEDIALVKINPNGSLAWHKTYGTVENENISRLLYSYGELYFGGEFTGSVGEKIIGRYTFNNLVPANTKAYISYILDEAPEEGMQQLTARPSAKIIVAKSDNIHNVQIYPNPFKDVLYIDYTSEEEGAIQMELLNTIGMSVLSQKFEAVRGINTFSIETKSNVALGVYYLKITDKEGNFTTHKVVH